MNNSKFYRLIICQRVFPFLVLIIPFILNSCNNPKGSKADLQLDSQTQILPFFPSVEANGTLYISGQISPAKKGEDKLIEEEAKEVMEKIGSILIQNGYTFNDVVRCAVYLADIKDYQTVNKVYASFFEGKFPSRVAMEVSRLAKDSRIEISAIAVKQN